MATSDLGQGAVLANGVVMPWVGLGVWEAPSRVLESLIPQAVEAGYRHIDTAAIYGNEEGVGRGIRAAGIPREQLFVTTKVWNSDQGFEQTLAAFSASLKRLGLDYVDLYLIHWAVPGKYRETWKALQKLYREGAVRAIGVSNFQVHHIEELLAEFEIAPMVNQIELHPYLTQTALVEFCQGRGIQVEAWSPLMRGGAVLRDPVIAAIAEKYHKTPAQVALRWNLERRVVVIPKTVHPERLKENLDLFDFALTPEEVEAITGLNRNQQSFPYDPERVTFG
jgi:diketogulonate reductase-like aldo/keto reductase